MDVESATAPVPVPQAPESVPPPVQESEEVMISDVPETEAPSSALDGDVSEIAADTTMEGGPSTSKRAPRQYVPPQKGTTVFPLARVSKIIKADSAVDICSKEATFLISAATELFIKKFVEEGCTNARMDKRKMVRYDDMAMQQRADLAQSGEGHALDVTAETPAEEPAETPVGAPHAESQDLDHISGVASEPAPYASIPEVPASSGQPVENRLML
ncbi:DNA-directed DNA polymerase [Malassezia japonica]|uniref:DNA-directed DNA polymerase n=1 Tax=Malassezia japonica TaxID=223818 RepID=A0AAF0JAJ7_9BASI|nr:DNA-directed DNA polymerase [Malassezia japonica]WFD39508.1 DNA-directed DNA polymerase [Malassezia japonica]